MEARSRILASVALFVPVDPKGGLLPVLFEIVGVFLVFDYFNSEFGTKRRSFVGSTGKNGAAYQRLAVTPAVSLTLRLAVALPCMALGVPAQRH